MATMKTRVRAEWHRLREVVMHRPGIEMFFGLLEPYSFLYERAFSMDDAVHEHRELEYLLNEEGVRVRRLKRIAIELAKGENTLLEQSRRLALGIVRFEGPKAERERAQSAFEKNIETMDPETVFNILVLKPRLVLEKRRGTRVIFPRVTLDVPLANLFFMRDQQAVTDMGVVVGRMAKPQRRMETVVTATILELMGAEIVHSVRSPGTFEGGDFLPADTFAMVGQGDRTNSAGVKQVLENGLDFDEVAVVHQPAHPLIPGNQRDPMINMHLDTYVNIAGEGIAVGCEPLLKRARVEVYRKNAAGRYTLRRSSENLHEYLKKKKFVIVPITTLEQMCYASNFLCVRDRRIIAIETDIVAEKVMRNLGAQASGNPGRYGALWEQAKQDRRRLTETGQFFPRKKEFQELGVETVPITLQEITGGYGGAHCMTATIDRAE
jgi:arginine deiminase